MSAADFLSEEECRCSICFDIFEDPVMLPCGHSFCNNCIKECWRQISLQVCPVCRKVCAITQPPRNLALRNLSESFRKSKSQNDCAEMCKVHSEKLKLFCEDDQQLICVICRDSKYHKTHNCVPVIEAAETQRSQLKVQLMSLKSKLCMFQSEKNKLDGMAHHIEVQTGLTEKTIKEEFQKLYRFLRAEETNRIDALRKEEAEKSKLMKDKIAKLASDISALTQKITDVEKELRAKDLPFMQKVEETIKLSQCNLSEPYIPRHALIDEAKHISNLLFTVWMKYEKCIEYVPVTLNPNTGSKLLTVSDMMTRSSTGIKSLQLPDNPERICAVLGYQGFKSGKHFWDVEVEGFWALGVAEDPCSSRDDVWGIYICNCHVWMHDIKNEDVISKDSFPKRVRVLLDYNQGILLFLDLDKKATVHTMKCTFKGTVFPYFEDNVKILPAKLL